MAHGGAVTDAEVERRIQDAAQVLLDLCFAQAAQAPDDVAPEVRRHFTTAQAISMAVQAVCIAEHLQVGATMAERLKGAKIDRGDFKVRFYGLGIGAGHCVGAATTPATKEVAMLALMDGIAHGFEMRVQAVRRMKRGGK